LRQELFGERHPSVATSINNLALLYYSQGRYEKAEPLYKQSLSLKQELFGERHPSVATSINNLAALYESQGRYEEAEPLCVRALQIAEVVLGLDHPNTVMYRKNLEIMRQKKKNTSRTWLQWIAVILLIPFYLLFTLIRWLICLFAKK
jgi:tetratricopeptide (TPR) repeat protein